MSTFDFMSPSDYEACVDAGRVPASVVAGSTRRDEADETRKWRQEHAVKPGAPTIPCGHGCDGEARMLASDELGADGMLHDFYACPECGRVQRPLSY